MLSLGINEAIDKIQNLMDSGQGDIGRLNYILESIRNNKPLYKSDQKFLETKLNSKVIPTPQKPEKPKNIFSPIQSLIESGISDAGRLQFIYDSLSKGKKLYYSDQTYLETKLGQKFSEIPLKEGKTMINLKTKLHSANEKILKLETIIEKNKQKPRLCQKPKEIGAKLGGSLPKDWCPTKAPQSILSGIDKKIKSEEEKMKEQKRLAEQINVQQSKLSQLIQNRKGYEQHVTIEKAKLEEKIQSERQKLSTQSKLNQEITKNEKDLVEAKKLRNELVNKIKKKKSFLRNEIKTQKKKLSQAKMEQNELEKQAKQERLELTRLLNQEKLRLGKQEQLAKQVKQKQNDLNLTRNEFIKITKQVEGEKQRLAEEQKLKKMIDQKEKDLIKIKEERINLLNKIEQQKQFISKKTKQEKLRLIQQKRLKTN